jgi:predicted secreted protein
MPKKLLIFTLLTGTLFLTGCGMFSVEEGRAKMSIPFEIPEPGADTNIAVGLAQEAPSAKIIETYVGQDFTITLDANATTGYSWEFVQPMDKGLLELVNSSYAIDHPGLPGSSGKQIWAIKAIKPGKTDIS